MKALLLALLLTACASSHQANVVVRDGHAEPQAATLQQSVQPLQKPAVRQQHVPVVKPKPGELGSPLPQKKNEHNIEED